MSFEEMQAILQTILLSQRELQLSQQRFQSEMEELRAITERSAAITERTSQITESNSRAIQAMLDQAATDRLRDEERRQENAQLRQEHERRMQRLEEISIGLINLTTSIDEDRPTILRLLNSTNRKIDTILDRLPPQS
jgi:hypothetical protein